MTQKQIYEIAYKVVGCAIEVHKFHGPGSLESVYQVCLIDELKAVDFMIPIYMAKLLS
jgi:GxxExxY protein